MKQNDKYNERIMREDKALMARVASHDPAAAAQVIERHGRIILTFLTRRMGNEHAEDLFQEVFLRALRGAPKFRGESKLSAWLYGIARNTISDFHRKNHSVDSLRSLIFEGSGPESILSSVEDRRRVVAALEQLPDEQAIVLELHRIDGMSHEQIGELLGIGIATSRKRLQRASTSLSTILESGDMTDRRHSQIESWRHSLLARALPQDAHDLSA